MNERNEAGVMYMNEFAVPSSEELESLVAG